MLEQNGWSSSHHKAWHTLTECGKAVRKSIQSSNNQAQTSMIQRLVEHISGIISGVTSETRLASLEYPSCNQLCHQLEFMPRPYFPSRCLLVLPACSWVLCLGVSASRILGL